DQPGHRARQDPDCERRARVRAGRPGARVPQGRAAPGLQLIDHAAQRSRPDAPSIRARTGSSPVHQPFRRTGPGPRRRSPRRPASHGAEDRRGSVEPRTARLVPDGRMGRSRAPAKTKTDRWEDTDMAGTGDGAAVFTCSVCGKSQKQVERLISGPGVYICEECIELCNEIIAEEIQAAQPAAEEQTALPTPQEIFGFL